MTWDEMDGLERAMSFKKLQKLFQEAMEREHERVHSLISWMNQNFSSDTGDQCRSSRMVNGN